jgi:hypothetical protein
VSAAKRRVKRKIAMLVRMDATHQLCQRRWRRPESERQAIAGRIQAAMIAAGKGLGRPEGIGRGIKAILAARIARKVTA